MTIEITSLSVGAFDNNVYILASDGEALIVDGADEADRILAAAEGLRVVGIVQTHGHFDHVQALPSLAERLGVPVYAHPDEGLPVDSTPVPDGAVLKVGSASVLVMHTPGHTPGSLCLVADSNLVSGDTLFPGGPGNTEGDPERFAQIMAALDRLFALPDNTRVLPGHGAATTIGAERPSLETWRARGW